MQIESRSLSTAMIISRRLWRLPSRARESIIVIAWDFNSNCCLNVECDGKDPRARLGDYLNHLAHTRPGLHIYILDWDFPMIYASDREAPAAVRLGWGWKPHERVHLEFDNTHPTGGSHHQKIVVIDDAMAFCGGLDLTCQRWDTPAHAPDEPRRVVADKPYPPFHDLMIAVDGEAARELGRVARERWRASTRNEIPPVRSQGDPWPRRARAGVCRSSHCGCRDCPGIGIPAGQARGRSAVPRHDRARTALYLHREPVLYGSLDRQRS